MSEKEAIKAVVDNIAKATAESFWASFDGYMKDVKPELRRKRQLIEFGLLAGAGLLIALVGLTASACWTAIQARKLAGGLAGDVFRTAFPHADFNQTLLFSSRNFKELLLWTAAWLAAPVIVAVGLSYVPRGFFYMEPLLSGIYPLAVIAGSYYIFSFWLTLAVYRWRGRLADPGEQSVKFGSGALLLCFFFIYVPLLETPLDLIIGLLIMNDLRRCYLKRAAAIMAD